jgi:hypothetical protein
VLENKLSHGLDRLLPWELCKQFLELRVQIFTISALV